MTGLWTRGADHIQIVVLGLFDRRRPGTAAGPLVRQGALLAEPRFILEPDLDVLLRMLLGDVPDVIQRVFLKASWACRSALRCRGRGIR